MNKAAFVYVTYIATTPEKVWDAITKGEVTRQYWEHENESDWKVGSRWQHRRTSASRRVDLVGKVVEVKPPHRLVITWAFTDDEADVTQHSRVTFEIEPVEKMVRLTVTHDDLVPGSKMEAGIHMGWPRVLSSMKSFLESGTPLDTFAGMHRPD